MNIERIRRDAPEESTHAVTEHGNTDYIKHECGNWYVWQNSIWVRLHPIIVKEYRKDMVRL